MDATALSCGNVDRSAFPTRHGVRWVDVSAVPGKDDVDPLLSDVGRLIVAGTDADLAAVVLRLLRRSRLADIEIGYAPVADSPAAHLWGLPVGAAAFEIAVDFPARPTPLIRDDVGGVVLGSSVIEPITGQVYCDDQRVLRGPALRLEVSPDPSASPLPEPTADPVAASPPPATDGLRVSATRRGLVRKRREVALGRAAQASFQSATVLRDGVAHPRPAEQWGWYRHTEDLLLVRP